MAEAGDEVAAAITRICTGDRSGVVVELDGGEPRVLEEGVPFPPR